MGITANGGRLRPALCLVASQFPGLEDCHGIGRRNRRLALLLARHGWRVHVLACAEPFQNEAWREVSAELAVTGIGLTHLSAVALPPAAKVPVWHAEAFLERSDHVRYALAQLHRQQRFDLIEFADAGALGFRAIQAKRAGLAFGDVHLLVTLQGPSQWQRDGAGRWLGNADELQLDYCERYAFENADCQAATSRYLLDCMRRCGWRVRGQANLTAVFPDPEPVPTAHAELITELVYFGALEPRKGLELFVRTASQFNPALRLTILGRDSVMADGQPASDYVRGALGDRMHRLDTGCSTGQALQYLGSAGRLAIIPSLADNIPDTVLECARAKVPFLAACRGGIPDLFPDPHVQTRILFDPSPRGLAAAVQTYCGLPAGARLALIERAHILVDPGAIRDQVLAAYADMTRNGQGLDSPSPPASAFPGMPAIAGRSVALRDAAPPLVTIAVPYYHLPEFLPETLASLAAQSYSPLEVIIVDDGSSEPEAMDVLEAQQARYPKFRFLRQANDGLASARNRALREARGQYFIPVDADNIARPDMVQRFVAALNPRPELAALSCYYLAFHRFEDIARGESPYAYRPPGGPHVLGSIRNIYGDANAIFRTEALRAVGGYEPDRGSTCEDWEVYVKLVNAGFRIDVVPEPLFYYRHRDGSMLRTADAYRNHQRVLRQYVQSARLSPVESLGLWNLLVSLYQRSEGLRGQVEELGQNGIALERHRDTLAKHVAAWMHHDAMIKVRLDYIARDRAQEAREAARRIEELTARNTELEAQCQEVEELYRDGGRRQAILLRHKDCLEQDVAALRCERQLLTELVAQLQMRPLRYRLADRLDAPLRRLPRTHRGLRSILAWSAARFRRAA